MSSYPKGKLSPFGKGLCYRNPNSRKWKIFYLGNLGGFSPWNNPLLIVRKPFVKKGQKELRKRKTRFLGDGGPWGGEFAGKFKIKKPTQTVQMSGIKSFGGEDGEKTQILFLGVCVKKKGDFFHLKFPNGGKGIFLPWFPRGAPYLGNIRFRIFLSERIIGKRFWARFGVFG